MTEPIYVVFSHGLGDCANFILVVRAYREMGFDVRVVCEANKKPFFDMAGIPNIDRSAPEAAGIPDHPWWEPDQLSRVPASNVLAQNKVWRNCKHRPLPNTEKSNQDIWRMLRQQRQTDLFNGCQADVANIVAELPRPILLLHAHGNTSPGQKDFPAAFPAEIASIFLRDTTGSVILLDWDNRVQWAHSSRTRHISHHYDAKLTSPAALMGLMAHADLLLGIDSGPFHLAGVIDMPAIGVWFDHHPVRYAVPRDNCLNIVTKAHIANLWGAADFNIIEQEPITPGYIASAIKLMLSNRRFNLPRGADAQLQLMLAKCFGGIVKNTKYVPNCVVDRNLTFSCVFDHVISLGRPPQIVETGCIREDNDWAGAGYSTFLLGLFAQRLGGSLLSVDLSAPNIKYAEKVCASLPAVKFQTNDSVVAIEALTTPVDVFYLDSMDANLPGHAEHGLKEAQASAQKVTPDGLIVFDDTINDGGKFLGKGALGVPWLLQQGWRVKAAGHQIVMWRGENV